MIADSTTLTPLEHIFGPHSQRVVQECGELVSGQMVLSEMIDYKIMVLVGLVCYIIVLYYFKGYVSALVEVFVKKNYTEKLTEEQSYLFSTFLRSLYGLGVVVCGICAVKVISVVSQGTLAINPPVMYVVTLVVTLVVLLISLYRMMALKMIGNIGSVFVIAQPIKRLSSVVLGASTLVLAPTILLVALTEGIIQDIGLYIVAFELICVAIFYLYKSYLLFVEQNVSIFYWFLYLCIVEAFPITLPIAVLMKLFA